MVKEQGEQWTMPPLSGVGLTRLRKKSRGGGLRWKLVVVAAIGLQVFVFLYVRQLSGQQRHPAHHRSEKAQRGRDELEGEHEEFVGLQTDEQKIFELHRQLQRQCGHRGIPAGDVHHMDGRKGPTRQVHQLLQELEQAYDGAKSKNAVEHFRQPQTDRRKAVWRDFEFSCFSQCGDDGLLYRIFGLIGWGDRRSVEIGYFPHEANSVNLIVNARFSGLLLDGNTDPIITESWYSPINRYLEILKDDHKKSYDLRTFKQPTEQDLQQRCSPFCLESCYNVNCQKSPITMKIPEFRKTLVTKDNLDSLITDAFSSSEIKQNIDFFSIDIDGMDYYILSNFLEIGYRPRVVTTEFASHLGKTLALTRPYSPSFHAAADSFQYGASITAFVKLLRRYQYRFIGCVEWNAYFILGQELRSKHLARLFPEADVDSCFYEDSSTLETDRRRKNLALQVPWVEVEVEAGAEPKSWKEIQKHLSTR
uniref:Methyltransferase FkbM domain-containing protein n=1 Tax=Hanusia phi TaxID=3032 RepID=A0A7S0E3L6_9CRYP